MAGVLLCRRLETFLWRCGGVEASDGRRWEIRGERESRRREEREALGFDGVRAGLLEQLDHLRVSLHFIIGQVTWNN